MHWVMNTPSAVPAADVRAALQAMPLPQLPIAAFAHVQAAMDAAVVQARALPQDVKVYVCLSGTVFIGDDAPQEGRPGATISAIVQVAAQGASDDPSV